MASKILKSKTQHRAKVSRKKPTLAEAKLWSRLRAHHKENVHFRRQHAIGKFIADFCTPRKKLIIEVDGSQHLDQEEYDTERTAFLELKGYRVLRFWNDEILNDTEAVLQVIYDALKE